MRAALLFINYCLLSTVYCPIVLFAEFEYLAADAAALFEQLAEEAALAEEEERGARARGEAVELLARAQRDVARRRAEREGREHTPPADLAVQHERERAPRQREEQERGRDLEGREHVVVLAREARGEHAREPVGRVVERRARERRGREQEEGEGARDELADARVVGDRGGRELARGFGPRLPQLLLVGPDAPLKLFDALG